jgi:prephenate dehydrogenase
MSPAAKPVPLRSPDVAHAHIAIVGLGLMGGSLAAALKERRACADVIGIPRRPETVARALELGYIDRGTVSLEEGVAKADVVVLATPVRTILATLPSLGALVPAGCLVLDLGSTKTRIARAMDALPEHVHVCPAHPMCGKETAGLEAAEPGLYLDKTFILTPLLRTAPQALALEEELVGAVGARSRHMDPRRHDRLVAVGSHLPYLLALSLVSTAEEISREDSLLWDLVASGFRDTSRLAASDVRMMLDVLLTNAGAVCEAIERFREPLETLERLLQSRDEQALRRLLEAAAIRRSATFRTGATRGSAARAGDGQATPPA